MNVDLCARMSKLDHLNYSLHFIYRLAADLLEKAKPRSGGNSTFNLNITDRLGFRDRATSRARSLARGKSINSNQNMVQRSTSHSHASVRGLSATRQNQMQHRSNNRIHTNDIEQASKKRRRLIRRSRSILREVSSVIERRNVQRGGINATQPNANGKKERIRRGGIAKQGNSSVRNRLVNAGKQQAAGHTSSR